MKDSTLRFPTLNLEMDNPAVIQIAEPDTVYDTRPERSREESNVANEHSVLLNLSFSYEKWI